MVADKDTLRNQGETIAAGKCLGHIPITSAKDIDDQIEVVELRWYQLAGTVVPNLAALIQKRAYHSASIVRHTTEIGIIEYAILFFEMWIGLCHCLKRV